MIFSPLTRFCDLLDDLLAAVGELLELTRGLELGLGAAPPGPAPGLGGEPPRLLDRCGEQPAGLLGELEHLLLGLPGAVAHRAGDPAQPSPGRARAIPDRGALGADLRRQLAPLPGQRPDPVGRQPRVGRIANVGLDHGRVDPRRPRTKALLSPGLPNQLARELVHHLGPQPARQLAHGRLVGHPLGQSQPAEAPQMDRVRYLAHQRLVPPPAPVLEHHQPHVGLHRQRRPPPIGKPAGLGQLPLPPHRDRHQQLRIAEQLVQARQIVGQHPHLLGQQFVPQRLRTVGEQRQH